MTMTKLAVALTLLGLALLPARQAAAQGATYAAIAFNKQTGATGYGYRARSRAAAEEKALQECGRGCVIVAWVSNQCLSLATGRGNRYGYSMSTNDARAMEQAVEQCERQTNNCEVNTTICSNRLPGG
jgi:hypothetical protein